MTHTAWQTLRSNRLLLSPDLRPMPCIYSGISPQPERFYSQTGKVYYQKALALAEPRGMLPLVAHCHRGLGKLYRRIGQRRRAQEHIATAMTMYADMGMQFWSENLETDIRGEVPTGNA
jgi:hypothetical protein